MLKEDVGRSHGLDHGGGDRRIDVLQVTGLRRIVKVRWLGGHPLQEVLVRVASQANGDDPDPIALGLLGSLLWRGAKVKDSQPPWVTVGQEHEDVAGLIPGAPGGEFVMSHHDPLIDRRTGAYLDGIYRRAQGLEVVAQGVSDVGGRVKLDHAHQVLREVHFGQKLLGCILEQVHLGAGRATTCAIIHAARVIDDQDDVGWPADDLFLALAAVTSEGQRHRKLDLTQDAADRLRLSLNGKRVWHLSRHRL